MQVIGKVGSKKCVDCTPRHKKTSEALLKQLVCNTQYQHSATSKRKSDHKDTKDLFRSGGKRCLMDGNSRLMRTTYGIQKFYTHRLCSSIVSTCLSVEIHTDSYSQFPRCLRVQSLTQHAGTPITEAFPNTNKPILDRLLVRIVLLPFVTQLVVRARPRYLGLAVYEPLHNKNNTTRNGSVAMKHS